MRGRLVNGLITDEATAEALLARLIPASAATRQRRAAPSITDCTHLPDDRANAHSALTAAANVAIICPQEQHLPVPGPTEEPCDTLPLAGGGSALALAAAAAAQAITIATVNNGDMIRMQGLTGEFNAAHPDIEVNWVTLEENILRERVTTDIATQGGQYDVMTIGNYEVPIWAKQGWLLPLENLGADYDVDDLLPAIRGGLTVDGKLYAAPFYGE